MLNSQRILLGIPVFNEAQYVEGVLAEVRQYASDILVIDDGSTDETPSMLARQPVEVIRHATNRGYGRSMQDMLRWAQFDGYDWLITMDCDLQHEPAAIPQFLEAIDRGQSDVISGSRYLRPHEGDDSPPPDRRNINRHMTRLVNAELGLGITDAFCGFKAYRTAGCAGLTLGVDGYDFPMEFWVEAWRAGLQVEELPVRLVYNDPTRTFGGALDEVDSRRRIYEATLQRALKRARCADAACRR